MHAEICAEHLMTQALSRTLFRYRDGRGVVSRSHADRDADCYFYRVQ